MTSFICDFAFQYWFGNKWILYSDFEIDVLNKALRKNQKTVKLPNRDPKKQIIVNFESMLQKNVVSNVEQRVRALIFIKQNFHAWMLQDGDDEYSSFRPYLVYILEAAFQQKLQTIKIYDKGDYTVDFKKFKKIDERGNGLRDVVRQKVDVVHSVGIEYIACKSKCLLAQMRQNDTVRLLCKEFRIFDTSVSSIQTVNPKKQYLNLQAKPLADNIVVSDIIDVSVDKEVPDADGYEVYSVGLLFYGAVLSSTVIDKNTNKYMVMQILKKDNQYFLWQRSGRIGQKARAELKHFGTKVDEVTKEFENRFYEKTKNDWKDVLTFKQLPGKYNLLKIDLGSEISSEKLTKLKEAAAKIESKLPLPVQELLSYIANQKLLGQIMEDMTYDVKQAPLGQLTVMQIKDGYSALNKIADFIFKGSTGKDLIAACDEFYSKIPQNFGRKKPPIIQRSEDIHEKMEMMKALMNINIAENIFNQSINSSENLLDQYYKSIECNLSPLYSSSTEYEELQKYFFGTCGPTHNSYQMEIIHIFKCNKSNQDISYANYGNKYLLWHGSRLTNWIGILKEGLRIAPIEAPSTGSMFGKGIYFSDCSTKSANYCFTNKEQNIGVLLCCEVCLGNSLVLRLPIEEMHRFLQPSIQSIIGRGKLVPSGFYSGVLAKDVKTPMGPLQINSTALTYLKYNEYVVYNLNQVKMNYLLLVKFNYK